ncbi:MAG: chemotaxis protein CheW [Deltaproteobacteria bacterium]|nr:chemotaxis protein CheW [Deltaproteobacteria bacterium]
MSESRTYGLALARDLIRVEVDSVMYALEIARIREIANPLPLIDLPREHQAVLGVSDYREEVVAVVDLRRVFGLPPQEPTRRTKWLILKTHRGLVAVVVDAVHDVFSSEKDRQRHVPMLDERQLERGIKSAYRYRERLVFLLDADRVAQPAFEIAPDEMPSLPAETP